MQELYQTLFLFLPEEFNFSFGKNRENRLE